MTDSTTHAVDYEAVLRSARDWGHSLATIRIRSGWEDPGSPLSGEWADDLTPQAIYARILGPDWDGGRPRWVDADTALPFDTDVFLTEICDAFEDAYYSAEWPGHEES